MSALDFDPYAQLAKQSEGAAKVAKPAKAALTLASLATLAEVKGRNSSLWDATEWQAYYDERAGIAEYDGGLSRSDAERRAYDCCIARWMNKNPSGHADANACPQCGNTTDNNSLAVLNPKGGHLWLHDKCHAGWLARRKAQAMAALLQLGIKPVKGVHHAD